MEPLTSIEIPGLDEHALKIITTRWNILHEHLSPYFDQDCPWFVALRFPVDHQQRKQLLHALEQHIDPNYSSLASGSADAPPLWRALVLLPIAAELGFVAAAERSQISLCISRGWFDKPIPGRKQKLRPTIDDLLTEVGAIRAEYETTQKRTQALRQRQLCRDDKTAYKVAQELIDGWVGGQAVNRLISLLGNLGTYGQIGLLSLSDHPLREELLLLERQSQYLIELSSDSERILGEVRQDIIALYYGLHDTHADLWQPDLFHGRSGTQRRKDFTKSLYPRLKKLAISRIAALRGCDVDTAQLLLWLFNLAGLPAIMGWRCGLEAKTAYRAFERQYVLMTLEWVTTGMNSWARDECSRITLCLIEALQEVDFQFSFKPLLTEYPSSSRRRRWGRRFWFGVPAVVSRRRVYRRSVKSKTNARRAWTQGHYTLDRQRSERLIARFAEIAILDENDARVRLRDFLTYGVLGLLPRWRWDDSIDPRIMSWLRLVKLGRLDGTVNWGVVRQRIEQYATSLGIAVPNIQVARALFNSISKPRYWHGGKGAAVEGIRQRATLILFGRPRLHATWLVISFPITLELSVGNPQRYYMLLVVDEGSELPMGGWLSKGLPTSHELGLAIYQSIWHPGLVEWPLHGIPEVIKIPKELVLDEPSDLQRAAINLMLQLDVVDKISLEGKTQTRKIRDDLTRVGSQSVKLQGDFEAFTLGIALRKLLVWLIPRYFPDHRVAEVPASIRKHNVAMAGYDTPAAGWLLPINGEIVTAQGGVLSRNSSYYSPYFRLEAGDSVKRREVPFFYPKLMALDPEPGIFIETDDAQLHYLPSA